MNQIKNNPNRQFHTTNQPIDAGHQKAQLKDPVNATQQVSSNQQAMETKAGYNHEVVKKAATQTKAPAKAAGKGSARSYRKKRTETKAEPQQTSKSGGVRAHYPPQLRAKMEALEKARDLDLAKSDPKEAWQSDDMARELVLNNPGMLKNLSASDRLLLLESLIDRGAGDAAKLNAKDGKAIIALLKSMPLEQVQALLDSVGGVGDLHALMTKHKCDPGDLNELYNIQDKAREAASQANAQKATGTGDDALSVSKQHFRQVNDEINSVTKELRGCKDKGRREELRMKLQELMQEKRQIFELITTMLKQMHDMAMSAIRKI